MKYFDVISAINNGDSTPPPPSSLVLFENGVLNDVMGGLYNMGGVGNQTWVPRSGGWLEELNSGYGVGLCYMYAGFNNPIPAGYSKLCYTVYGDRQNNGSGGLVGRARVGYSTDNGRSITAYNEYQFPSSGQSVTGQIALSGAVYLKFYVDCQYDTYPGGRSLLRVYKLWLE